MPLGLVGRGGVLWADAVKIGNMLSASSPTSHKSCLGLLLVANP